jgi:uncharacterized membrane protein
MIHLLIDNHLIIAATIGGIAILNAGVFWFMPRLSRRDLYFAVTVPPGLRDQSQGTSILRRYRIELIFLSVLALVAFVAGIARFGVGFVSTGHLIQVAASFIAFYRARLRVLPYAVPPTMIREADLHGHDRIIPGGWIAAAGPFILLVICGAYFWFHGGEPSSRFGTANGHEWALWHWGAAGPPDGSSVYGLSVYLLSTGGILVALTLILYGLAHWVRPVYTGGPEHAHELKFRRAVSAILLAAEYYLTIQASWIVLVPRHGVLARVGLFPLALVFALVAIVVLARLGQGGSRMRAADDPRTVNSAVPIGDRTPDRYWKLGVFYFNPDDSAVLVEKRFGLGYSLNFARPTSWIILLLVLMAPLIPLLAHLTHLFPKFGV